MATLLLIDNSRRRGIINVETIQLPAETKNYQIFDINDFMNDAIYTEANAMEVGKRFGLPMYNEIDEWIRRRHPEIQVA